MAAPQYSAADYLAALQALMPRGVAWPRDAGALQTMVLAGLVKSYETQNQRANNLLVDAFPASAVELLPEWESTLGLPSAAAGPNPSTLARQTLVIARLVGSLGVSVANLQQYAALLGYQVTLTKLAPFRCGQSCCGQVLGGVERLFGLIVSASNNAQTPFGAYGPAVLKDEMQRVAPPYSFLTFNFT
jgi:uncharacterized protein YmfQ (DUF2313 family)